MLAGEGSRLQLAAAGEELARLAAALGTEIAPFGPYQLEGTLVGSLDSLAVQDAGAAAGDERTRIELAGAIRDAFALSGFELAVTVEGRDLAALSPIARVDLPSSEPYRMTGNVTGSAADA